MGLLFLVAGTGAAGAEKRVALVIGNGAYKAQRLLENPANDARLVSQALTAARFAVVDTKTDLGIGEFRQALRRFQSLSTGADVAFVYFAGHGMEVGGVNWLIPTDAELAEDRNLEYEAIKTDLVLQALAGANLRVLVIDACRDNPFGRGWRSATRNTGAGLAKLEADDVLVLFAAAPGRTASDGSEGNSPFAKALARRLPEPGVPIQLLGGNVRDDVLAATNGVQRPYVSASITGRPFYLMPAEPVKPAAPRADGRRCRTRVAGRQEHEQHGRAAGLPRAISQRSRLRRPGERPTCAPVATAGVAAASLGVRPVGAAGAADRSRHHQDRRAESRARRPNRASADSLQHQERALYFGARPDAQGAARRPVLLLRQG